MALQIGGYRNNPSTSDIDLSQPVQNTEEDKQEVTVVEPTSKEVIIGEVQNTDIEIEDTSNVLDLGKKPEVVNEPPVQPNPVEVTKPVVVPEQVKVDKVEVTDEILLTKLSEKLGRDIKDFSDLSTETKDPLADDPYLKELSEWRKRTNRPIEDWIKFQKDYTKVSDVEVAREFLQLEYPTLDAQEIELELSRKFLATEDDLDYDAKIKNLELKKYASKGRETLKSYVSELGEADKNLKLPEDVRQAVEFAHSQKDLILKNADNIKAYNSRIKDTADNVKAFKLDLAEGVSIDFKLGENSSKDLVSMIVDAPQWKTADGGWDHERIVSDSAKLANFDKAIKLAYEQGLNAGKDHIIQEAKNTTLSNRSTQSAALPNSQTGVVIEGLDNYLGKKGVSIRSRRR